MSLAKKYNVPQETVKKMIADGVISCSWPSYEQIYAMYQKSMSIGGKSKAEIIHEICEATKAKERTVYYALEKFK